MNKEGLKDYVKSLKLDSELEQLTFDLIDNAKEINQDVLDRLAKIVDVQADFHEEAADMLDQEADFYDNLTGDLQEAQAKGEAEQAEVIQKNQEELLSDIQAKMQEPTPSQTPSPSTVSNPTQ